MRYVVGMWGAQRRNSLAKETWVHVEGARTKGQGEVMKPVLVLVLFVILFTVLYR